MTSTQTECIHGPLYSCAGDDILCGSVGRDFLGGGAGNDRIRGSGGGTVYALNFEEPVAIELPADVFSRGNGWAVGRQTDAQGQSSYYSVSNWFNRLSTRDSGNVIDGVAGDDLIRSGTGDDLVHGGADHEDIMGMQGAVSSRQVGRNQMRNPAHKQDFRFLNGLLRPMVDHDKRGRKRLIIGSRLDAQPCRTHQQPTQDHSHGVSA
ncbi:hypothetical protein [Piscinibacterium candidicorallinum]|uniref:Hemolysin-type calcium-binding repeat-containing protein n=1 Tax=Piscinibacterium candidicorallinum TaxID=1793872 RepID=A0ABV7H4F8_9BURK